MSIDEEREELRRKMESLQNMGHVLERVQVHAKYLSTIPFEELSGVQKLWGLAYEATNLKMVPGTEESLFEAAINLETLESMIEHTIKEVPTKPERPGFSLFGRRR